VVIGATLGYGQCSIAQTPKGGFESEQIVSCTVQASQRFPQTVVERAGHH